MEDIANLTTGGWRSRSPKLARGRHLLKRLHGHVLAEDKKNPMGMESDP
jgi:hypothetical protein